MPPDDPQVFRYRILRYMPNLLRDEWINIGVLLEQPSPREGEQSSRRAIRILEDEAEIVRVRRMHREADDTVLRALASEFQSAVREPDSRPAAFLDKLDRTLSNAVQFGPQVALVAADFDAALDRLYHDHVEPLPLSDKPGLLENTRGWIRARLNDVFGRHRILGKLERGVRVEEFTQPGDPLRIDYAYGLNGTRGYLHVVLLGRDPAPAKILAYTAGCVRSRAPHSEFTAITEQDFSSGNARHAFVARLFEAQSIATVPLQRVESFAESLRLRLH